MTARPRALAPLAAAATAVATAAVLVLAMNAPAAAAQPQVGLGTATPFAVLAGSTVTNTGTSVISGSVGLSPGTAVVGFPPGIVNDGTIHATDAVAAQAQSDLTTAYNDAAGRGPVVSKTGQDLGGQTLVPGVYNAAAAMALTGTLTLDAGGDPDAVFVFQAGSTLTTASSSRVALIGGAQACRVFWQVTSSATLGSSTQFAGSILALTSITLQTSAVVMGRVLARNGAVTLDSNTITRPACAAPAATPTATPTPTATTTPTAGTTPTVGPGATSTASPTSTPTSDTPTSGTPTGTVGGPGGGGGGGGIPTGHPETGATQGRAPASGWLVVGLLCLGGAGGAAIVGSRSARRHSTRRT